MDRTQIVQIGDCISSSIDVYSGVGQGSHSGTLLFSFFFNDLPRVIKHSSFQMFADDVKIYTSISGKIASCFNRILIHFTNGFL